MRNTLLALVITLGVSSALFLQPQETIYGAGPALTVPQGGTGTSTVPTNWVLIGSTTNRITAVATSSLGLPTFSDLASYLALTAWYSTTTSDIEEGSNLYFTTARATTSFIGNLAATTSVSSITALPSLGTVSTSLTGILKATAGVLSTASAGTDYENPLTFVAPLYRSANSISWFGLSTTSQPASSNLLVSNGTNGIYGVATSSVSFIGPFTVPTTLGKLVGGSGSVAWTGLATSSAITSGQVLYGTSASGVASVATSSLAVGSSLSVSSGSLGYQIGGTNATIGLNLGNSNTWTVLQNFNYSSSTIYSSFAAASSTNWLGGGLSTCTGANHLQWSGGFFACAADPIGGNIATSSAETAGRLAYWTTTSGTPAKLGTVATTTLSVSGPLGITAARGALVGGSNATISWSGLATTTTISSGQVLYGTSVSGVSSVATSTLAVGSSLSVASGVFGYQVGGSNVTFGLNLGNANSWTALQTFANASTSLLSSAGLFTNYINATSTTATSTFSGGVVFSGTIQLAASQPATSTAIVLDWSRTLPQIEYQIGTSATSITIINATTSTQWGSRKMVWVCNPGSTAGAVTWTGVEWIGTAPTQTTTANQCDVYSFDVTRATSTSAYKVAGTMGAGFQ